jgi:glutamate racemase
MDVIESQLEALCGQAIPVVDSAHATAEELAVLIAERNLATESPHNGKLKLLVTDMPEKFGELVNRFLEEEIGSGDVEQIDL